MCITYARNYTTTNYKLFTDGWGFSTQNSFQPRAESAGDCGHLRDMAGRKAILDCDRLCICPRPSLLQLKKIHFFIAHQKILKLYTVKVD